jgi:hypothetical protein
MTMTNTFQQEIWQELERAATENARRAMLHAIGYEEMTYHRDHHRPPSPPPPPRFDEHIQHWFSSIVMPFIAWIVKTCLFLFTLLLLSIGIYSFIWGTIMRGLDVKSHKVYFDYSPGGYANNVAVPTAIVDLRSMKNSPWSHSCGEQVSDQSPSPSGEYTCLNNDSEMISYSVGQEHNITDVENSILAPGQRYFFELILTLPESDINKQLGVFMVKVELLSANRSLLATSKQPSMLPYESSIVTIFRKTMLILPLAFGVMSETRTVTLLTFDHYTDGSDKEPMSLVEVTLGVPNPAAFPTSLQSIQILSADLRYGKEMNAIQSFLRHWQYSCAIIVISALFLGFLSITMSILNRRAQRRRWNEEPYADFFDSVNDESADNVSVSSHDRWMGADIEILDDSENDSNAWQPIVPNEENTKTKGTAHDENAPLPDNVVSDDESSSIRQKQSDDQKIGKFSTGELGTNSTPTHQEPLIATTLDKGHEHRNHIAVDEISCSQKKEEEQLADMVMKGQYLPPLLVR